MKQQAKSLVQSCRTALVHEKSKFACPVIVVVLVTLFCIGLFTPGLPVGTDLLLLPLQLGFFRKHFLWFSLWLPLDSFGYPIFFGTQFNFVLFLFGSIFDAILVTKFYVYAVFLLAAFSMYFFGCHYLNHHAASLLAAIMFVFNPIFLLEVYAGHHTIILGYAIAPLLWLTFDRALITGKIKDIILSSITFAILFITGHPQTMYIFGSFLLLFALFEFLLPRNEKGRLDALKRVAKVSLSVIILLILFSAYEIVPVLFNVMWSNVLFSLGYTIEDAYAYSGLVYHILWIALPLLVILTVFLRKNRYTLFFSISSIVSSIISLGPFPPFGGIFTWAFLYVPLFNMFRVPYRFLLMTAFSASFLTGFVVTKESTRLRRHNLGSMQKKSKRIFFASKRILITLAFAGMIVGSGFYVAYGAFGFPLTTYAFPDSYTRTYEWIGQQPGDYRILTVPYPAHYVNSSLMTGINRGWVWDPPVYGQAIHGKVVVTGYGGTVDTSDFLSFLGSQILYNRTDDMMKVLGAFNVKYVTVHPYPFRDEPELTESIKAFFAFQKGLTLVYQSDNITVLENKFWTPHIFSTENYALISGGRDVFMSLQKVNTFNQSRWVLIFANQLDLETFNELLEDANMIVLSDDGFTDLVMISFGDEAKIKAAQYAFPSSNPSKYWIPSKWWIDQGKLVINGASLRTNGTNWLEIPLNVQQTKEYTVFFRIAFGPDRGRISVYVDGSFLTAFVPHSSGLAGFKWVDVGSMNLKEGKHTLRLENDGLGFTDIDEIAILAKGEFESKIDETKNAIEASPATLIYILEAENAFTFKDLRNWRVKPTYEASNGYALVYNHTRKSGQLFTDIYVPRSGQYMLGARILTGTVGNIIINIDQRQQFTLTSHNVSSGFNWISLGPIDMVSGQHKITLEGSGECQMDELIFYSANESFVSISGVFETESQTYVNYEQVSSNKYNVDVKADSPFFLVFSESYHPMWKAYINGESISALPAYSFVNAFYIPKGGRYDMTVEFSGQSYVVYGGLISIGTIMVLGVYFTFGKKIDSLILKKLRKPIKS